MKKDALIVVGRLSYPGGSAPSNRVHLYCKALKEAKGFPLIINLNSNRIKPKTYKYLGRNEGIPFYNAQKSPVRKKKFLQKNIDRLKGVINSFIIISRLEKKNNVKVLFFCAPQPIEFIFFLFLKCIKVSIIKEINEVPSIIRIGKKMTLYDNLVMNLRLKMYDQLIVISDYLNIFYSNRFSKKNIFQIPILVDMERFNNYKINTINKKKIITYVGSMAGNKDGLENLIEAMVIVKGNMKDTQLQLVGSAPEEDMLRLKNMVESMGLKKTISFLGKKMPDEIPFILASSDILVLARPNNNQAKGGFPTKLGEYLASGRPVVITRTGEIPKYLTDNETAYLAEPDDINDFADKMVFALNDKNAVRIGLNGYDIANKNFNYKLYCKEILGIISGRKKQNEND